MNVEDLGTYSTESTDYPIYAEKAALAIRSKEANRAVLICGSGFGISFAANKIPGMRAGIVGTKLAQEIVVSFLGAIFTKKERFLRRLSQVENIKRRY